MVSSSFFRFGECNWWWRRQQQHQHPCMLSCEHIYVFCFNNVMCIIDQRTLDREALYSRDPGPECNAEASRVWFSCGCDLYTRRTITSPTAQSIRKEVVTQFDSEIHKPMQIFAKWSEHIFCTPRNEINNNPTTGRTSYRPRARGSFFQHIFIIALKMVYGMQPRLIGNCLRLIGWCAGGEMCEEMFA